MSFWRRDSTEEGRRYLRPLWVYKQHPELPLETSWLDWPAELRATYDLDDIPQEPRWPGWGFRAPLAEESLVQRIQRLGRLVQPVPAVVPIAQPPSSTDPKPEGAAGAPALVTEQGVGLAGTNARVSEVPEDEKTEERTEDPSTRADLNDPGREGDPFARIPEDE